MLYLFTVIYNYLTKWKIKGHAGARRGIFLLVVSDNCNILVYHRSFLWESECVCVCFSLFPLKLIRITTRKIFPRYKIKIKVLFIVATLPTLFLLKLKQNWILFLIFSIFALFLFLRLFRDLRRNKNSN